MKIAMSGASGFVGTGLSEAFREDGHEVTAIERDDFTGGSERVCSLIRGSEVVVNLAGAPIIARWSESYKRVLYASRIDTTRLMVRCMASMKPHERPSTFISTSAVGIYAAETRPIQSLIMSLPRMDFWACWQGTGRQRQRLRDNMASAP